MATIKVCDICHSSKDIRTESFTIGRELDAAGSMEDIVETYDLCSIHLISTLKQTIQFIIDSHISIYEINDFAVNYIKKRIDQKERKNAQ